MSQQEWLSKDYYASLDLKKEASDDDIKKSYRKLSRKYHPDLNQGDKKKEEKYKEISEAYSVLSDKEQKKQYDAIRAMGGQGARFTGGWGNSGQQPSGGFEDIFSNIFGGGGGRTYTRTYTTGNSFGSSQNANQGFGNTGGFNQNTNNPFGNIFSQFAGSSQTRGKDINASTTIPFENTLRETTLELKVANKTIKTRIPAGILDGQKIKIPGKGYQSQTGGAPGDLILEINVQPNKIYKTQGKDVHIDKEISLKDFLLGAALEIPTPYGETKKIKIPAGSSSNSIYRIKGAGIKTAKGAGDEYVHIFIKAPKKISKDLKNAL
ncbi:MAG: DnaJ domain-containing protein [Bifidobacteriaceae bacterium]|jgi:molecular chaperone DnaJ|nr:DnaJ domain-containing protein [Bifidobacteriaceae bacterium]